MHWVSNFAWDEGGWSEYAVIRKNGWCSSFSYLATIYTRIHINDLQLHLVGL